MTEYSCFFNELQAGIRAAGIPVCYNFSMSASTNSAAPPPAIATAREVLEIEARAITDLIRRIDAEFEKAVTILLQCRGRVVVSGIGKSGHIARKIAATLASTGTPAFFVHPAEASHGDLGMVTRDDVFVALSNSGETAELMLIIPVLKRQGAKLIALTGNPQSTLGREADVHLYAGAAVEACPLNLAPTASTTAALALGDAIAVALMRERGFTQDEFARSHPGGALGRRLLTRVSDVMRSGDNAPRVTDNATLAEALLEMSRGRMGMTAVVDNNLAVKGIFTDGDLRRAIAKGLDLRATRITEVMSANPRTIGPEHLAAQAAEIMETGKVTQLLVVDDSTRLLGALNIHDLFRGKVV